MCIRDRRGGGGRGLRGGPAAVLPEDHVRAGVERLRAVRPLPDAVDQMAPGPCRHLPVEDVLPVGQLRIGDLRERLRLQVGPLQRLGRVVAALGEVQLEGPPVGRRGLVVEGVAARPHRGRGPVAPGQVQALVLRAVGTAQLAVRDACFGLPSRVAVPYAVPVVERLGATGLHGRLARRGLRALRPLGEAGRDPADRVRHRTVRGGRARGEHGERERRDAGQRDPGGFTTNAHRGGLLHQLCRARARGSAVVGGRTQTTAPSPRERRQRPAAPPDEKHASPAEQRI